MINILTTRSGFTLTAIDGLDVEGIAGSNVCAHPLGKATSTSSLYTQDPYPQGVRVHNAWYITWEQSDLKSLRPTPPPLADYSCTYQPAVILTSWVPGEDVDRHSLNPQACNVDAGTSHASRQQTRVFFVLTIGLPLIFVSIVLIFCTLCIRRRRKTKKAKTEEQIATSTLPKATTASRLK